MTIVTGPANAGPAAASKPKAAPKTSGAESFHQILGNVTKGKQAAKTTVPASAKLSRLVAQKH